MGLSLPVGLLLLSLGSLDGRPFLLVEDYVPLDHYRLALQCWLPVIT
jgi:hypothetical protein